MREGADGVPPFADRWLAHVVPVAWYGVERWVPVPRVARRLVAYEMVADALTRRAVPDRDAPRLRAERVAFQLVSRYGQRTGHPGTLAEEARSLLLEGAQREKSEESRECARLVPALLRELALCWACLPEAGEALPLPWDQWSHAWAEWWWPVSGRTYLDRARLQLRDASRTAFGMAVDHALVGREPGVRP